MSLFTPTVISSRITDSFYSKQSLTIIFHKKIWLVTKFLCRFWIPIILNNLTSYVEITSSQNSANQSISISLYLSLWGARSLFLPRCIHTYTLIHRIVFHVCNVHSVYRSQGFKRINILIINFAYKNSFRYFIELIWHFQLNLKINTSFLCRLHPMTFLFFCRCSLLSYLFLNFQTAIVFTNWT